MSAHSILDAQNRALDHVLADVEYLADRRSFRSACQRFGEFRRGLEAHLTEAESVVLPVYVASTNDPMQIRPQLRRQHAEVLGALERVSEALSCSDHGAFLRALDALAGAVRAHDASEEKLLNPSLERLLANDPGWQALRRRDPSAPTHS